MLNKNIFCASNPAKIIDALCQVIENANVELKDILVFLPSRRAVRTVEKFLAGRAGGAVILPRMVALGEAPEDDILEPLEDENIISDTERLFNLVQILKNDPVIASVANALPVAKDLIRIMDYMENEGVSCSDFDWENLIGDVYPEHFRHNAKMLEILSEISKNFPENKTSLVAHRNKGIRNWINVLDNYKLVVVCASTASVPATADLMREIAKKTFGRIILSGVIQGTLSDLELDTNPYHSEYMFLKSLNMSPEDVIRIDVGNPETILFMNHAFTNNPLLPKNPNAVEHCRLVECAREAEEADCVAQIVAQEIKNHKSVLVITPDQAVNQRLAVAFEANNIVADFSNAISGNLIPAGRALLNVLDNWFDNNPEEFTKYYTNANFDLLQMVVDLVDSHYEFTPKFEFDSPESICVWNAIKQLSDVISAKNIKLNLKDARAFLSDAILSASARNKIKENPDVIVLGTIESRMQTADVVILTGLNEGIFPTTGYETSWIPRNVADKIGLPGPDRKISLMALDFMNLSCNPTVYWTRSLVSGGVQTTQSRFISRVCARGGKINLEYSKKILDAVRSKDNVEYRPLEKNWPVLKHPDKSDVFVTELDWLINNPYGFYVKHILKLNVLNDYWESPDARDFGILVHNVIQNTKDFLPESLIKQLDDAAYQKLGNNNSVLFKFWHNRFKEIAPKISEELQLLQNAKSEIMGSVSIASRTVKARADKVWDGGVLDIKTGAAPKESNLFGKEPQLPLEAYILQNNGFPFATSEKSKNPVIWFLQLKHNYVKPCKYNQSETADMIKETVNTVEKLFNEYNVDNKEYVYPDDKLDQKYQAFDDLARKTNGA